MTAQKIMPSRPSWLLVILAAALVVRFAASIVLAEPPQSDGLAYLTMAGNLASGAGLADNFGQKVFYSAGYPLLLTPMVAAIGASMNAVIALNLVLALVTGWLLHTLVLRLCGRPGAALAAVAVWAVWLPAVWNATMPAKENLSTPLLLVVLIAALDLAHGRGRALWNGLAGGLGWGAGVVTGGSSILAAAAFGAAILCRRDRTVWRALAGLALGGALTLGLWLVVTERMVGAPVINTNAEFNLYLGNNPAATGSFVSIADTPVGPQWQRRHAELGELGAARWLGHEARAWIAANPAAAIKLAIIKLGLFWAPNVPDKTDFAASKAIATVRLADVALYLAVLATALVALAGRRLDRRDQWVIGALILGFWAVHAAAYVMPRYRDPLAPILIALAACWAWPLVQVRLRRP